MSQDCLRTGKQNESNVGPQTILTAQARGAPRHNQSSTSFWYVMKCITWTVGEHGAAVALGPYLPAAALSVSLIDADIHGKLGVTACKADMH